MCFLARCEICGEVMEYEEFFAHSKECKPDLEKVEVKATQTTGKKKKSK